MIISQKITIIRVKNPSHNGINEKLQWLGDSLGLFNLRDKDKSCFRVFIELLKAAKMEEPMSSDELAEKLGITRGTVVHHLNKLMDAGIVAYHNNKYLLRAETLKELTEEIRRDVNKTFDKLSGIADEIDEALGL